MKCTQSPLGYRSDRLRDSYLSIYIYIERERERERDTCVLPKGFELESFQLKYNPPTFKYNIHSLEVDLYYFKYLQIKNQVC